MIHTQILLKMPEMPLLPNHNHLIHSFLALLGCYKCCISRGSAIAALLAFLATSSYLSNQIYLATNASYCAFVSVRLLAFAVIYPAYVFIHLLHKFYTHSNNFKYASLFDLSLVIFATVIIIPSDSEVNS